MIDPVVDADWLRDNAAAIVLADVRWYLDGRSGREEYAAGHLPGAVFVDLDQWLAGAPSPAQGRHPLPTPEHFARGMGELGIGDDDTVVAYDDAGGVIAARLVWMLRALGHDAALLDGGVATWEGMLVLPPARRDPAVFTARPWPNEQLADIDATADAGPHVTVIDARQRERYLGGPDPVDPRSGHIPGARNLPCRENLDEDGRFLSATALRQRFSAVGIESGDEVISYCGSGVTACHNLLAMEHAGLGTGRLFAGSWSQYSHDPTRRVATDNR